MAGAVEGRTILVPGAAGSFGQTMARHMPRQQAAGANSVAVSVVGAERRPHTGEPTTAEHSILTTAFRRVAPRHRNTGRAA